MALKLNRDDTINLIRIYGEYECLWNCRKKVYSNHVLKKEAWETIANNFDSDVAEIKKKIKYLRTAYVAERRKLEESKKNTANPSEFYQPKLFYYNDFNYLDNTIVLRKRDFTDKDYEDDEELLPKKEISYDELSNETNERLQENESVWEKCTPEDYLDEDFQQPQFKKVKLTSQHSSNSPLSTINFEHYLNDGIHKHSKNSSPVAEDMYLAFGKSVGLQLKHLKTVNAAKAMAQIQEVLTKFAISEA
ncbi:uncharacterized protein LOC101462699 [Ceratitis capitata]|uniref:MADF domain-containing protein n=1 Tax=Ceratitis capitata TaxID=7213 RepID=W8BBG6_CERCA|nr:uncharacterized protein LOC101462699 [Ceratitis capitata]